MVDDISYNFDTLDESQDDILAHYGAGKISHYILPKDTVLFKESESRQCAYFIEKGTVGIYGVPEGASTETPELLCSLGEGEIFGDMALIGSAPRTATAITSEECGIFVIPRDSLQERLGGLDPIVSLMVSLLIERYRSSSSQLPETLKQVTAKDLHEKTTHYDNLPKELHNLRDTAQQMEIALKELQIEHEIRAGLTNKEFVPVLQPILKLPEERVVGFEALVRWQHPERGLLTPNFFIPAAERSRVIQNLDRLMLENACKALPEFIKMSGNPDFFISVNLSGINFETIDIVNKVAATLQEQGTNPKNIKLEITESALINDPAHAEDVLQQLKNMGLRIALDDFGTGYSSLGYLHKFSIDYIKIDRSFISQIHDGTKSLDIVRAIVSLARNFDLELIAEGIENEKDVIVLNSLGCDMGQGFFYGRPLEIPDAMEFVKNNVKKLDDAS